MNAVSQILFETKMRGGTPLAIFTRYVAPLGAETEREGSEAVSFWHQCLKDASCGPPLVGFCADGLITFVTAHDVNQALSPIWSALLTNELMPGAWVAEFKTDGTWCDLLPFPGAMRELPNKIL